LEAGRGARQAVTLRSPLGEVPVILCRRTSDGGLVAKGSWPGTCAICGTSIWLAPSSRSIMSRLGARAVCIPCLPPQSRPLGTKYAWTQGQKDELRAEGVPESLIEELDRYFTKEL
jgi:hypothetical protein